MKKFNQRRELAKLSPELRAEIERQLPKASRQTGLPIPFLWEIIALTEYATIAQGGAANLPIEIEAYCTIDFALQAWAAACPEQVAAMANPACIKPTRGEIFFQ